jgi:murein DD-endopeptidase MepM/ murein hydrolase activator NlpD
MRIYIILALISFFLMSCSSEELKEEFVEAPVLKPNEYNLIVDSLREIRGVVDRNETISDILNPHNIPLQKIYRIADASKNVFDFTKINFGKNYTLYSTIDSIETVKYFVYEIDPINYVVCDLSDSINIYKESREVTTRIREVSGIIDNSLYMTLKEQNASDLLALKLADVYAWQIDFYGIQAGDYFKVIFEENFVDTTFIGVGKINTALFNHKDKDFYAFRFEQNGKDEYFDEDGNGLRKAFLKAPLKFSRISSGYTNRRFHPILKYYRPHRGIDYAAPTGTPIQSVGDGTVTDVRWTKQGGRFVKVKHNSTYSSGYMHLSKYAKGIKPGVRVSQGDIIGYVGSSGLATGPHLDFRFWKNGQLVNYLRQEFPSSYPIKESDLDSFKFYKDSLKTRLDNIQIEFPASEVASQN